MAEVEKFAHGYYYGDYSGVVFYGTPTDGFWLDRLAVSDCYIRPLFCGILDRAWVETGGELVPRLASEWNTLEGWSGCGAGITEMSHRDAEDLMAALGEVTVADLAPHVAGATAEECLRCAAVIREFVRDRLARGVRLFIEDN